MSLLDLELKRKCRQLSLEPGHTLKWVAFFATPHAHPWYYLLLELDFETRLVKTLRLDTGEVNFFSIESILYDMMSSETENGLQWMKL